MSIRKAVLSDLKTVKQISETAISEIYPHYYPKGAVEFFIKHHSEDHTSEDIEQDRVFLCSDAAGDPVGTVTVKANEICRLFVLPACQGNGYGAELLAYAEKSFRSSMQRSCWPLPCPQRASIERKGIGKPGFISLRQTTLIFCAMIL